MRLTNEQLVEFYNEGYLFLPNQFRKEEIKLLKTEALRLYALERKEVWREKSGVARTVFAAHTYSEPFRRLGAHPRLIEPVMQILAGKVYMHQYKINAKTAFDGEVWQWHQDYGTWRRDDDMRESRAMNIAVFLDEVNAANGPLMFIPRSHKSGVLQASHDLEGTNYPLWTLDRGTITKLANEGGIEVPLGPAGSVVMFHGNLVHASPPNISPWTRTIAYLSLCEVTNHIRCFQRPEWIASRDFTPIKPIADNCLLELSCGNDRDKG